MRRELMTFWVRGNGVSEEVNFAAALAVLFGVRRRGRGGYVVQRGRVR